MTLSPVLRLPQQIEPIRLLNALEDRGAIERLHERGTISLTYRPNAKDPWTDGLTAEVLRPDQPFYFSEGDFSELNPELKGTYFESCLVLFRECALERLGRVRVFSRSPRTCSSLHQDLDVRLHVALKTNVDSFLIFPKEGLFHIPADGHIYLIDTTRPHFAVNTHGSESRLHIVASTWCGFKEDRFRQIEILNAARALYSEIAAKKNVVQMAPLREESERLDERIP